MRVIDRLTWGDGDGGEGGGGEERREKGNIPSWTPADQTLLPPSLLPFFSVGRVPFSLVQKEEEEDPSRVKKSSFLSFFPLLIFLPSSLYEDFFSLPLLDADKKASFSSLSPSPYFFFGSEEMFEKHLLFWVGR